MCSFTFFLQVVKIMIPLLKFYFHDDILSYQRVIFQIDRYMHRIERYVDRTDKQMNRLIDRLISWSIDGYVQTFL